MGMTPRQKQLLAAIIEEFINTAQAVGSSSLRESHGLRVSPATIRNEMQALVEEGYLEKLHSSSGRIPTEQGFRAFLQDLDQDNAYQAPDIVTQEKVKRSLHVARFSKDELIREALRFLSEYSGNAAVALVDKEIYYAGLAEMLNIPELQEIQNLRTLLTVLEDYAMLSNIFNKNKSDHEVKVLIGTEAGLDTFRPYAVVFSELRLHGGKQGYLALVGPNRMNYKRIIPAVGFAARSINSMASGW